MCVKVIHFIFIFYMNSFVEAIFIYGAILYLRLTNVTHIVLARDVEKPELSGSKVDAYVVT